MVRLVGFVNMSFEKLFVLFQFHYGTIGSLKKQLDFYRYDSFNSTMVRLVDILDDQKPDNYQVSIPLWYDW